MSTISDKVLNKINKDKLAPLPKWQFQLRDLGRWLSLALLVLLVVVALGLLMLFWSDGPWLHGGMQGAGMLFGRMPLILLALVLFGGIFALIDFMHTRRGYRYPIKIILPTLIIVALVSGLALYFSGLSRGLDRVIGKAPFYQDREAYMLQVWQNPNKGLVAGEIIVILDENNLLLRDFSDKNWQIDTTNALWRHSLKPELGLQVKLLGQANGDKFKATEVRPWMGSAGCGRMSVEGTCDMNR